MPDCFLHALQTHRSALRTRWARLLRAEPAPSPLGNPEALLHLMDWTLDRVERELGRPGRRLPALQRRPGDACRCGSNPLRCYFETGEYALFEILLIDAEEIAALNPSLKEIGLRRLQAAFRQVARTEIESLCAVCRQTAAVPRPRLSGRRIPGAQVGPPERAAR